MNKADDSIIELKDPKSKFIMFLFYSIQMITDRTLSRMRKFPCE